MEEEHAARQQLFDQRTTYRVRVSRLVMQFGPLAEDSTATMKAIQFENNPIPQNKFMVLVLSFPLPIII